MKKICWIQHASEYPLVNVLASELSSFGFESVFICKTKTEFEKYKQAGYKAFFISEIFNIQEKVPASTLARLETDYGHIAIKGPINSDVHLPLLFKNLEDQENFIAKAYLFWEKFLQENKIDYFIAREVAGFATRTAYNIAKKRGIPFTQLAIGPASGTFIFSDLGETSVWSSLISALNKGNVSILDNEKKQVDDFIAKRLPPKERKMVLRFVPVSFLKSVKQIIGTLVRNNSFFINQDPIKSAALLHGSNFLIKRLAWKIITKNFFRYDVPEKEKYIYFPLYSGNETGYLTDDHYWAVNQYSLIKEVAQSLPNGCYLYVKEHPTNPGYFNYFQLKRLQKLGNVKVLHPAESSQWLIENSEAIFVLQGTAGWEAFLSKKPVISLGKSFYAYSDLVYKIDDIRILPKIISQAIKVGCEIYQKREEEWYWFIHIVLNTCQAGSLVNLEPPYGFVTDKKNGQAIARAIKLKIEEDLFFIKKD